MAVEMRVCAVCGRNRQVKFYKAKAGRVCVTCQRQKRGASTKDARLQETYDITHAEWLAILAAQGGKCAICKGRRVLRGRPDYDTDHDHALERLGYSMRECLRGLLCKRCNRRLLPGCTDSVTVLEAAIDYILHGNERTQLVLQMVRSGYTQTEPGIWVQQS